MVFGDRLAGIPAGPELAAVLASIDPTTVPNGSIVEFLQACARQRAHSDGLYLAAMASALERNPAAGPDSVAVLAEPDRYAPDEVRAALAKTRRAELSESGFAYDLCRGLPTVHAQMLAGRLDWDRAWVFTQHLTGLPVELVTKVLDALLAEAPGLATGQLRARILKLILTADPDRAAKRAGHPGLVDQLRADIYLRLLDGRFHHLTRTEMITALLAETPPVPPVASSQASPAEPPAAEATTTQDAART